MCLAIPVKIIEVNGKDAIIEAEGVQRKVNVALIKNPSVGDHVLVHAGFAIQKWSEEDLKEYNEIVENK